MDTTIADMYYIQLPTGGATQGDVWSNLPSFGDTEQICKGLIITPRCDFAHSKSPVLNYLPIISLEKYLLSIACFPHFEQVMGETRESLRAKSSLLDIEHLFELDIPLEEIRKELELSRSTLTAPRSKQLQKADADFDAGYFKIKELTALLQKKQSTIEQLRSVLSKKKLSNIQRDLIKNNNADTYFLPPCPLLLESPSLVLLRHIYTCPISTVDRHRIEIDLPNPDSLPERLLRLASPFIESLMSKFAALFTRVGTRDIPDQMVRAFMLSEGETTT